jgi:CopG antitoxin of type II toxin-antitoxin system
MKAKKHGKVSRRVVRDYDAADTSTMIDPSRPLKFEDVGLRLPDIPPTQVISIRLPSRLLNELKAISSERDVPYQALIKLLLSESVSHYKKRSSS